MKQIVLVVVFQVLVHACSPQRVNTDLFSPGRSLGKNKNEKLEEASGLVASVRNKGFLWSHNDGGKAELFLLDTTAVTRKVFLLSRVKNRDWEDITLGTGPEVGVPYLYIGDIGDNYARQPFKLIYRVKEPTLDGPGTIYKIDTLVVKLSDEMRDTETLLNDPLTGRLYVVSKRDRPVGLYEIENPRPGDTLEAKRIADLPIRHIVGGSISPDGSEVLMKSYEAVYYWKRNGSEPLVELLMKAPLLLPYEPEEQGEAIAWALDGSGYYTLGENGKGDRARLFFYARKSKAENNKK